MIKSIIKIAKKNEEIIVYLIVGGLTTLISLITYYLCVNTFLNPNDAIQLQIANILSWIISVSFAYITNRVFVFKSKSKKILKEIISFVGARIITLLLDMFIMFFMVTLLHINDSISKIFSQILVIVLNYIFSKLFVFKK
jgi:putative flippase GtrA